MIKRILLSAALVSAVLFAGEPASAQGTAAQPQKITFLTNYVFHGRHSPFFVGLEKGFYKEAGFDIQISPATGSGFVVTALDAGRADYGMADPGSLIQQVAKGAKVKAFNVFMDVTTSGLASLKPYPTPESLKGAKIAASLTDSARVTVPIIMQMNKVDPSSIQWQTVDPSVYFSLLLGGQVDLITASIDGDMPAITKVAAPQGKNVLFASFPDWGYDVFGYFLMTRADRIAEKPAEVKAFSAASVKAVKYAMSHPEETAQIMVKHNPTLNYDTTLAQWKQSIKAIDTAYMHKNGYGIATTDRLQRTIDLTKQALKLEAALKPDDVFAPGFVAR
jgi:NitT/TauT family transport system substrate-binding protein